MIDSLRGSRSTITPTNEPMARPTTPATAAMTADIRVRRSPPRNWFARARAERSHAWCSSCPRLSWGDASRTLSKVVERVERDPPPLSAARAQLRREEETGMPVQHCNERIKKSLRAPDGIRG